jgi:ribosomal protein S18 acetylase RimI-like enzyme
MDIREDWSEIPFQRFMDLYRAVGWTIYADDPNYLKTAFEHSTRVFYIQKEEKVIGLLRSLSDMASIHYIQDILVEPEHQRQGIGRKLLQKAIDSFSHVRTHLLMTDDEEKQLAFYQSMGLKNTKTLVKYPLNTFVKFKGIDLE